MAEFEYEFDRCEEEEEEEEDSEAMYDWNEDDSRTYKMNEWKGKFKELRLKLELTLTLGLAAGDLSAVAKAQKLILEESIDHEINLCYSAKLEFCGYYLIKITEIAKQFLGLRYSKALRRSIIKNLSQKYIKINQYTYEKTMSGYLI